MTGVAGSASFTGLVSAEARIGNCAMLKRSTPARAEASVRTPSFHGLVMQIIPQYSPPLPHGEASRQPTDRPTKMRRCRAPWRYGLSDPFRVIPPVTLLASLEPT